MYIEWCISGYVYKITTLNDMSTPSNNKIVRLITELQKDTNVPSYVVTKILATLEWKDLSIIAKADPKLFFDTLMGDYTDLSDEMNSSGVDFVIKWSESILICVHDSVDTNSKLMNNIASIRGGAGWHVLVLAGRFLGMLVSVCPFVKEFFAICENVNALVAALGPQGYREFMKHYASSDMETLFCHILTDSITVDSKLFDAIESPHLLGKLTCRLTDMLPRTRTTFLSWLCTNPSRIKHININISLPHLIEYCTKTSDCTAVLCAIPPDTIKRYGSLPYLLNQWAHNTENLPIVLLMRTLHLYDERDGPIIPDLICSILNSNSYYEYCKHVNTERIINYCKELTSKK